MTSRTHGRIAGSGRQTASACYEEADGRRRLPATRKRSADGVWLLRYRLSWSDCVGLVFTIPFLDFPRPRGRRVAMLRFTLVVVWVSIVGVVSSRRCERE